MNSKEKYILLSNAEDTYKNYRADKKKYADSDLGVYNKRFINATIQKIKKVKELGIMYSNSPYRKNIGDVHYYQVLLEYQEDMINGMYNAAESFINKQVVKFIEGDYTTDDVIYSLHYLRYVDMIANTVMPNPKSSIIPYDKYVLDDKVRFNFAVSTDRWANKIYSNVNKYGLISGLISEYEKHKEEYNNSDKDIKDNKRFITRSVRVFIMMRQMAMLTTLPFYKLDELLDDFMGIIIEFMEHELSDKDLSNNYKHKKLLMAHLYNIHDIINMKYKGNYYKDLISEEVSTLFNREVKRDLDSIVYSWYIKLYDMK